MGEVVGSEDGKMISRKHMMIMISTMISVTFVSIPMKTTQKSC